MDLRVIDLDGRTAVLDAKDDGSASFPHGLRGVLAGMLAIPGWHVVVALRTEPRPPVGEVLDHAQVWAAEGQCELTVTVRERPSPSAAADR